MKEGFLPIIYSSTVPIINIIKVESNSDTNLLKTLYRALECRTVEKINIDGKYDLILDEEGLFNTEHQTGFQLPKFPNKSMSDNVFVGKCTIVKVITNKSGDKCWGLLNDEIEAQMVIEKYLTPITIIGLNNY